jgi:DNA-binding CsgD family transcriptional regulator/PII-like signaling protein
MTVTSAANRVRLHGRDGEVALVEDLLRRVSEAGNAGAIVIKGAAGIGKTALLDTVVERAIEAGFSVVRSKADESHQIAPMAPLLLALRSGSSPVLSREAFESLASFRNHPLWLIDRIVGIIEGHASKKPLLIALDDVQWADRLTLSCLRIMPPRLAGMPIVWAIASRDPGPPMPLAEFADSQALEIHRIGLEPLGDAAIERIAADRVGVERASALRQQLKNAAGNPFFAVEIVDGLSETISKIEHGMLPAHLREQIARRVSSLSAEARTLVRLGSVFGTPFTVEDLRATSGLEQTRLLPALDELLSEGMLRSDGGTIGFRHNLLRQAVYENTEPAIRNDLHAAILNYLTSIGRARVEAVPHAIAARVDSGASSVAVLVEASRSIATSMPSVAARLALRAHAMVPESDETWFDVGEAVLNVLAQCRLGNQVVTFADRLAEKAVAANLRASLHVRVAWPLWYMGHVEEMMRRVEFVRGQDDVSPSIRAEIDAFRALALSGGSDYTAAYEAGTAALDQSRALGLASAQTTSLRALAEASINDGRYDDALMYLRQIQLPADKANTLVQEIVLLQFLDRFDESAERLQRAHFELENGNGPRAADVAFAQLWHDYTAGNFDDAETDALTLINDSEEVNENTYRVEGRLVLSRLRQLRGDFKGALGHIAIAEETESTRNEMQTLLISVAKAFVLANQGDFASALPHVREVAQAQRVRHRWRWQPGWLMIAARTAVRTGDEQVAKETLQLAEDLAQRNPNIATIVGILEHIRGLTHRDVQALQRASQILEESPRRFLVGDALADYGEELLSRGHRIAAVAVLERASERFTALGAQCDVDRVAQLLQRAGGKKSRFKAKPLTGWSSLTRTEQRVAKLIAEGHTNRSAARVLALSANTIATHLRAIFGKLAVNSRVQLTRTLLAIAQADPAQPT